MKRKLPPQVIGWLIAGPLLLLLGSFQDNLEPWPEIKPHLWNAIHRVADFETQLEATTPPWAYVVIVILSLIMIVLIERRS